MKHVISDTDFFKRSVQKENIKPGDVIKDKMRPLAVKPLKLGNEVNSAVSRCIAGLKKTDQTKLAAELEKVRQNAEHEYFTVAIVGEFSRGKSSFVNRLLEKEFLPTGNLPTTAIMTRIRYNSSEKIAIFDKNNKKVFESPLSLNAWDNYTVEIDDNDDFRGTALVGIASQWMKRLKLEIIDTPGAEDLSEYRAGVIGDALLGCDGAIITVSAVNALGSSEKMFIEQRLLARQISFLMIIVTKMDLIKKEERSAVLQYICSRLREWKMEKSEEKLRKVYQDIIEQGRQNERIWMETQEEAINAVQVNQNANQLESICQKRMILQKAEEHIRELCISKKYNTTKYEKGEKRDGYGDE